MGSLVERSATRSSIRRKGGLDRCHLKRKRSYRSEEDPVNGSVSIH